MYLHIVLVIKLAGLLWKILDLTNKITAKNTDHVFFQTCSSNEAGSDEDGNDADVDYDDNDEEEIEEEVEDDPSVRFMKEKKKDKNNIPDANDLIFVYQSATMKRLYRLCGTHFLLLDATYKTCKYSVPLFFLVVKNNVNYQVVAVFVVQHETKELIQKAIQTVKSWNPDITPKYGMVDFSTEEIDALEATFPGTFLCFVTYPISKK